MTLPNPDRTFPNTDIVGPPGPSGSDYADKVAAEGQALWDRIINVLGNIGGSANAITADCDPPLVASYQHGQQFWLVPTANNTGPATLNVDGRGAVDLVAFDGSPLEADDLVAGEGAPIVFDGTAGEMRLMGMTARALMAMAAQGGEQVWELIGDSGPIGTVANVEFSFVPNRYSRIVMVSTRFSVVLGGGTASAVQHTLRHTGNYIILLRGSTNFGGGQSTHRSEFVLDIDAGTGLYFGKMDGIAPGNTIHEVTDGNTSATPASRVRCAFANGSGNESWNASGGRVVAWGMRPSP